MHGSKNVGWMEHSFSSQRSKWMKLQGSLAEPIWRISYKNNMIRGITLTGYYVQSCPSEFVCFRSDERSFYRWNNEAICQKIFFIILSMNRPWDPVIMQWSRATACGKAVFREGGNIMTQKWTPKPREHLLYRFGQQHRRGTENHIGENSPKQSPSSSRLGTHRRRPQGMIEISSDFPLLSAHAPVRSHQRLLDITHRGRATAPLASTGAKVEKKVLTTFLWCNIFPKECCIRNHHIIIYNYIYIDGTHFRFLSNLTVVRQHPPTMQQGTSSPPTKIH